MGGGEGGAGKGVTVRRHRLLPAENETGRVERREEGVEEEDEEDEVTWRRN